MLKFGTFAALRVRDFRLLLLGTTLSNAAQWIQQVTLGWLVYELTGSGTALGTISLVGGTVDTRASLLPLTDSLQKLPDYYSALRNVVAEHRAAFVLEGKQGATSPQADNCAQGAGDDF